MDHRAKERNNSKNIPNPISDARLFKSCHRTSNSAPKSEDQATWLSPQREVEHVHLKYDSLKHAKGSLKEQAELSAKRRNLAEAN